MAQIEKTIFISYRRTDVYTALAIYENLKNHGYDVFFDYKSISSGDFEQIITSNIRARAHFLLILTPTALDRCSEPDDWLRREIEFAMDEKRNIVPLFLKGFQFSVLSQSGIAKLLRRGKSGAMTGKLKDISRYNGLRVHEDYFEEAMTRLRTEYLNKPLDMVLHPVSTEVQKVVKEEQSAADEALKKKGIVKEAVDEVEEKLDKATELEILKSQAIRLELQGKFWDALQLYYTIKKIDPAFPRLDVKIQELEEEIKPKPIHLEPRRGFEWRSLAGVASVLTFLVLSLWGGSSLYGTLANRNPQLTQRPSPTVTVTAKPTITDTPIKTKTPSPTETSAPFISTSEFEIGSTMIGKDGMKLLYVPAGDFIMGSNFGETNERPVHSVSLNSFWIDETEVTNAMYIVFLNDQGNQNYGGVSWLDAKDNDANIRQLGNMWVIETSYENHPVVEVSWYGALAYCEWVGRTLPTEAQWEKAARGIDERTYPWGNDISGNGRLNYNNFLKDTTIVGSYPKGVSPYGGLDMAGNVSEWVLDWYSETFYQISPVENPSGPTSEQSSRVRRGGSYYDHDYIVRSVYRSASDPDFTDSKVGFRCAMDAP